MTIRSNRSVALGQGHLNPFYERGFDELLRCLQEASIEVLGYEKEGTKYFFVDMLSSRGQNFNVSCYAATGLIAIGYDAFYLHPGSFGRPTVEILFGVH